MCDYRKRFHRLKAATSFASKANHFAIQALGFHASKRAGRADRNVNPSRRVSIVRTSVDQSAYQFFVAFHHSGGV
jgi:hypothetical protein